MREDVDIVKESELAAITGLRARELRDIIACLVPAKKRGNKCWYRWPDIEPFLDDAQQAHARQALRALRTRLTGSKYWVAGYPELVARWHRARNNDLTPDEVRIGTARRFWWCCPRGPDHEWFIAPRHQRQNKGCPFCQGQRVSVTNSLASCRSALAQQWHPTRNGKLSPKDVAIGSTRRAWWKCAAGPDHVWVTQVRARAINEGGCPFCSRKRNSRATSLAQLNPNVAREWHPTRNGLLRPEDVSVRSSKVVWWKCPIAPDHTWQASVGNRGGSKPTGCPCCAGRNVARSNSLSINHPALARQWHPTRNHPVRPADVTSGAHFQAWWICSKGPDHIWRAKVVARTRRRSGCPFCAGQRVSVTNSLATMLPALARQWHPSRNGTRTPESVTPGSAKPAWWQCPANPRHEWSCSPNQRTTRRPKCPLCSREQRVQGGGASPRSDERSVPGDRRSRVR